MTDIKEAPYAEWLEGVLREMLDLEPQSIAVVMLMPDRTRGTAYWNIDDVDLAVMMDAIAEDKYLGWIRNNREELLMELNSEDGDEDGLCESNPEADS